MKKKTIYSRRLDAAISFATEAHSGQFRKTDPSLPYISHPTAVGLLLMRAGASEDTIIAGILHDVVEDTPKTIKEIRARFGNRVASIVASVSEDKKLPWHKRKEDYLKKVLAGPSGAKAVSVADKLHNAQSILQAVDVDDDVWFHFAKDKKTTVENFARFVSIMKDRWKNPLLTELEHAVRRLKALVR